MKKPDPQKNAKCFSCGVVKPLLMPVPWTPGYPVVEWDLLCCDCRLAAESQPPYADLGWEWEHAKRQQTRDVYQKWLKKENKKCTN